jgi:hypothetical protein
LLADELLARHSGISGLQVLVAGVMLILAVVVDVLAANSGTPLEGSQ